jgi:hypothetical protein
MEEVLWKYDIKNALAESRGWSGQVKTEEASALGGSTFFGVEKDEGETDKNMGDYFVSCDGFFRKMEELIGIFWGVCHLNDPLGRCSPFAASQTSRNHILSRHLHHFQHMVLRWSSHSL